MEYGLIGNPLGHSISPEIHRRFAAYSYELCPLSPEDLPGFLRARAFRGINVTIPYKQAVIPYLDEMDPVAREIGAVNTVVNRAGRLIGYNTDCFGFSALLESAGIDPAGKNILILGTGGTSHTARYVLTGRGAARIRCVSRRPAGEGEIDYPTACRAGTDVDLIINTTPVGMYPNTDAAPIDLACFPHLSGVADVIYRPLRTQWVRAAEARGIRAVGGMMMLVAQAAGAAELFTGTSISREMITKVYNETVRDRIPIILIGMPGCGKTTVGSLLAGRMGRTFIDLDREITRAAGCDIPTLFREGGESAFREWESRLLNAVLRQGENIVLATGGGAVLSPENRARMRDAGWVVFLDRHTEALVPTADRPTAPDREAIRRLWSEREALYRETASFTLPVRGDAETTANELWEVWRA